MTLFHLLTKKVSVLLHCTSHVLYVVKENSERNLDFLSIPQSGGKMSKRLGGVIGCKDKISSWYLNGFPDDSTVTLIGSTV